MPPVGRVRHGAGATDPDVRGAEPLTAGPAASPSVPAASARADLEYHIDPHEDLDLLDTVWQTPRDVPRVSKPDTCDIGCSRCHTTSHLPPAAGVKRRGHTAHQARHHATEHPGSFGGSPPLPALRRCRYESPSQRVCREDRDIAQQKGSNHKCIPNVHSI